MIGVGLNDDMYHHFTITQYIGDDKNLFNCKQIQITDDIPYEMESDALENAFIKAFELINI